MNTTMLAQLKNTLQTWGFHHPVTIQTADVDGYGNYSDELTKELRLSAARPAAPRKQSLEIEPEEFETVYGWFYS